MDFAEDATDSSDAESEVHYEILKVAMTDNDDGERICSVRSEEENVDNTVDGKNEIHGGSNSRVPNSDMQITDVSIDSGIQPVSYEKHIQDVELQDQKNPDDSSAVINITNFQRNDFIFGTRYQNNWKISGFHNPDHAINKVSHASPILEASASTNDESNAESDECNSIIGTLITGTEMSIDQKFLDFMNIDGEPVPGTSEISDAPEMIGTTNSIPSKCDSSCSTGRTPVGSHIDTLAKQELNTIRDECNTIAGTVIEEMSIDQTIMEYRDVDAEPVTGRNKISNENQIDIASSILSKYNSVISSFISACNPEISHIDTLVEQESNTIWDECNTIVGTVIEEMSIDQNIMEYRDVDAQSVTARNEVSNENKIIEKTNSNPSKSDTLVGDCSSESTPVMSHIDTLEKQESYTKWDDYNAITRTEIEQVSIDQKKMKYRNIDAEPVTGKNEISNPNETTETANSIPSKCDMPLSGNSSVNTQAASHIDMLKKHESRNTNMKPDFGEFGDSGSDLILPVQQSTEIINLQDASEPVIVGNDEVSVLSKNKEQTKNKRSSGTKRKASDLKEAQKASKEEKDILIGLIKEYGENMKQEKYTFHDLVDFITERKPSISYRKVIHVVRISVVNNLKNGFLKACGEKMWRSQS